MAGFNLGNLSAGIRAVNLAGAPAIPNWFPIGTAFPISHEQFKSAVLNKCAQVTNGGVQNNFCIAPNTLTEYGNIAATVSALCLDPFVVAVANAAGGPLARFHMFTERVVRQTAQEMNIVVPFLPPGVQQAFI